MHAQVSIVRLNLRAKTALPQPPNQPTVSVGRWVWSGGMWWYDVVVCGFLVDTLSTTERETRIQERHKAPPKISPVDALSTTERETRKQGRHQAPPKGGTRPHPRAAQGPTH